MIKVNNILQMSVQIEEILDYISLHLFNVNGENFNTSILISRREILFRQKENISTW
jgi:hypothetical protein